MQQDSFSLSTGKTVERINNKEAHDLILNTHYAGRLPSISYSFGLFRDGVLAGIVTYGKPSSSPQRKGVCGPDFAGYVLELNRLCLVDNLKNEASYLVGASLRMLPKPAVIISYADPEQGHEGYIYQATNFIYCGLTEKRTEWKVRGMEHLHSATLADKFRGVKNPAKAIRAKYGDDFYLKPRPRKHRYIIFIGSKTEKRTFRKNLRYKQDQYPKKPTGERR